MNEQEIEFKIKCLIARGRNIVYYRRIDNRPRCQYIHVVRSYRKDVRELSLSLPDEGEYRIYKRLFKIVIIVIMV